MWRAEALHLADSLAEAIRAESRGDIEAWVGLVRTDPERLGSAFYMVYQIARDYLERWPPS